MNIGFYAPLKPINHPTPSGDRQMGRLLFRALGDCGFDVDIISVLRSWEGEGLRVEQEKIMKRSEVEFEKLKLRYKENPKLKPQLIWTYHVYHKAPDWLGVKVAKYLGIPYVIVEPSFAPKQANGRWQLGHRQTLRCINQADLIVALNPEDEECIEPLLKPTQSTFYLHPFLRKYDLEFKKVDGLRQQLAKKHEINTNKVWLITVAMMRKGDKSDSYQFLANALKKIDSKSWHLIVIGDGSAHDEVVRSFEYLSESCTFLGEQIQQEVFQWLSVSDVFAWPAVNEAYGLALLEALSWGLPIVAQNYGGVATIVENGKTGFVSNPELPDDYVLALNSLIGDENQRIEMGKQAEIKFTSQHTYDDALKKIKAICENLARE